MRSEGLVSKATKAVVAAAGCAAILGASVLMAPAASAAGFDQADDFHAGALLTNEDVTLSLTKYKQTTAGKDATGSVNDAANIGADATPLAGVGFALYPITGIAAGKTAADMIVDNASAGTTGTPTVQNATVGGTAEKSGSTDGAGKVQWDLGKFTSVKYYVLQETTHPNGTEVSQNTLIGLPFYTNDGTNTGYLYHVSVFPKNISSNQVNKSVNGPIVAQAGNKFRYTISEKISNHAKGDNSPAHAAPAQGDGYLDLSEISADAQQHTAQLRIADQIPSSLSENGDPTVSWSCAGANGGTLAASTDYTLTRGTTDPGRLSGNTAGNLFNTSTGANYVYVDLFKTATAANAFLTATHSCTSSVTFDVVINATMTGAGDGTGNVAGTLVNVANADVYDGKGGPVNPDGPADVSSATAGLQFAKTKSDSTSALPGAIFHLAKPGEASNQSFLQENGEFGNGSQSPWVAATSNANGVVTFSGLPLFKASDYTETNGASTLPADKVVDAPWIVDAANGSAGKLDLVEAQAPNGYELPQSAFSTVDFNGANGAVSGKTAAQLQSSGHVTPTISNNIFGADYTADSTKMANKFKDASGNVIKLGLKNFKPSEAPIGLPLTGGKGIVLFLVVGSVIMAATLMVRRRYHGGAETTKA